MLDASLYLSVDLCRFSQGSGLIEARIEIFQTNLQTTYLSFKRGLFMQNGLKLLQAIECL